MKASTFLQLVDLLHQWNSMARDDFVRSREFSSGNSARRMYPFSYLQVRKCHGFRRPRWQKLLPIFPPRESWWSRMKRDASGLLANADLEPSRRATSYFKCRIQIRAVSSRHPRLRPVVLNRMRERFALAAPPGCKVERSWRGGRARDNAVVIERWVNEPHTKELENPPVEQSGRCVGFGYHGKESNQKHKSRTKTKDNCKIRSCLTQISCCSIESFCARERASKKVEKSEWETRTE